MAGETDSIEQKILEINWSESPGTIEELLVLIVDQLNISREEGLKIVDGLISKGELSLIVEREISSDFFGYLLSNKAVWFRISVLFSVLTLLSVFLIGETNFPYTYIRNLFGSIFVIMLPGYSLVKIFYPLKEISLSIRVILSVGLSITLVSILGLVLNYTPWGISLYPLIISLFLLVIVFSIIGAQREHIKLVMEGI